MSVIIGIDIGGSTTKIVGFKEKGGKFELVEPQLVRANDPVTATYGAFGKFTDENSMNISDISKIMMTGVGASYVKHNLYGLDCGRVAEFDSIGTGGLYLSGLSEALIVSMGTGTAIVHAKKDGEMKYLGVWWSGAQVWENNAAAIADGGQANIYPKANATTEAFYKNNAEMKTGDTTPFIVDKDNRERIGVVYQMHLQANRDSVVIGSALADNCPLCTNYTANEGTAYVLPHTINTFGSVDLTGATLTTFSVNNGQIVVANPGIAGTKAWVIVDTQNNIYIGENTDENNGGNFPTIYISTK